jgi:hypothetical protein
MSDLTDLHDEVRDMIEGLDTIASGLSGTKASIFGIGASLIAAGKMDSYHVLGVVDGNRQIAEKKMTSLRDSFNQILLQIERVMDT